MSGIIEENKEICSICLENIVPDSKVLQCNHKFHKICINKWLDHCIYLNCPLCRTDIECNFIFNHTYNQNKLYKIINFDNTNKFVNYQYFKNINNNLINEEQIPKSWNRIYDIENNYNDILTPVYFLDNLKLTFYARLFILFSKSENIKLEKYNSINDIVYYDTDEYILNNISKKQIYLLFDWAYDVLMQFKNKINIKYYSVSNSFIFDLFFITIKKLNITETHKYQAIVMMAILNSIVYLEKIKNITFEEINYFTEYSYTKEELSDIINFQESYIKNNIIFF